METKGAGKGNIFTFRKLIAAGLLVVLVAGCIFLLTLYKARPIVSDTTSKIVSVEVYNAQGDKQIPLPKESYNEEEIVRILSRYGEKRTPSKDHGFACAEVELRIVIFDQLRGMRDIRLGKQSYSCGERGSNRYEILQPSELLSQLRGAISEA